MNTPTESGKTPPLRRSVFSRVTLIAFVAGAALAGSIVALAATGAAMGSCGFHHGMMMGGPNGATDVSAHIDHVLKHLYVEIDANDAQQAQITPMVPVAQPWRMAAAASSLPWRAPTRHDVTDGRRDLGSSLARRLLGA